ncbi:MAG: hypothetical protein ABIV36_13800 [Sphingobium limneticum]
MIHRISSVTGGHRTLWRSDHEAPLLLGRYVSREALAMPSWYQHHFRGTNASALCRVERKLRAQFAEYYDPGNAAQDLCLREKQLMPYEDMSDDLSTSFDVLSPAFAADTGAFLRDAALALNVKEAEMARMMGVSRATFSGWRAREAIPSHHQQWFRESFVEQVVVRRGHGIHGGFRHAGIEFALDLLRATRFDPFGLHWTDTESAFQCARYFEGLVQLCLFCSNRLGSFKHAHARDEAGWLALVRTTAGSILSSSPGLCGAIRLQNPVDTVSQSE